MGELEETWGLDDLLADPIAASDPLLEDLSPGQTVFLPSYFDDALTTKALHPLSEWPAQLPIALALQVEDIPAILDRFGITPERFELLKPLPAFRKAVAEAQRDVREQGHTFKLKCKAIAEDFLDSLYLELQNPQVGLTTKVDVFKYLTKMGGLEPQAAVAASQNQAVAVSIQINL